MAVRATLGRLVIAAGAVSEQLNGYRLSHCTGWTGGQVGVGTMNGPAIVYSNITKLQRAIGGTVHHGSKVSLQLVKLVVEALAQLALAVRAREKFKSTHFLCAGNQWNPHACSLHTRFDFGNEKCKAHSETQPAQLRVPEQTHVGMK